MLTFFRTLFRRFLRWLLPRKHGRPALWPAPPQPKAPALFSGPVVLALGNGWNIEVLPAAVVKPDEWFLTVDVRCLVSPNRHKAWVWPPQLGPIVTVPPGVN